MAKCSAQLARIAGAAGLWAFWEDFLEKLGLKFLGVVVIIPPNSFSYEGFLYFKYRGQASQIWWIRFSFLGGCRAGVPSQSKEPLALRRQA